MDNQIKFCRKCGKQIPSDSLFCSYCGTPVIRQVSDNAELESFSTKYSTFSNTNPYDTPHKRHRYGLPVLILCVILVAIIAFAIYWSNKAPVDPLPTPIPTATMIPQSLPKTGEIFSGAYIKRGSKLTIECTSTNSCYVKLKNIYQQTAFSFFVRAGETVTMDVPSGQFYVYFAYGDTWYGIKNAFGAETVYAKDSELLDFSKNTFTYTLYPVTNGNFTETKIDASEF